MCDLQDLHSVKDGKDENVIKDEQSNNSSWSG